MIVQKCFFTFLRSPIFQESNCCIFILAGFCNRKAGIYRTNRNIIILRIVCRKYKCTYVFSNFTLCTFVGIPSALEIHSCLSAGKQICGFLWSHSDVTVLEISIISHFLYFFCRFNMSFIIPWLCTIAYIIKELVSCHSSCYLLYELSRNPCICSAHSHWGYSVIF